MKRIFAKCIAFGFLLISCSSGDMIERELRRFSNKEIYKNTYDGWRIRQTFPQKFTTEYTVEKIDNDTLKLLSFGVPEKDSPYIIEYKERFPCFNSDTCYLDMQPGYDTLFLYRLRHNKKEFIVGEYYYRYYSLKLTKKESNYFESHSDSLLKVRGNNLPSLPTN